MHVVMAVADPHPAAMLALARATKPEHRLQFVNVAGDPFNYWRLFAALWRAGEPFVLVEHDIVLRPDVVPELEACPEPWCALPYREAKGDPVTGLGCVKFVPDPGLRETFDNWIPPTWANVDATVAGLLHAAGWAVHEHQPPLRHLNPRLTESENPDE